MSFDDLNMRDLGGMEIAGGLRVAQRRIYRCQGPDRFTDANRGAMDALGLRLVCDMRSSAERARSSHQWADGVRLVHLDLNDDVGGHGSPVRQVLRDNPTSAVARDAMRASYARMPGAIRPHLAGIIAAIEDGELPLLIHCTAGKDRTGVMVALLLLCIGAPLASVMADYLLSLTFTRQLRARVDITAAFSQMYGVTLDDEAVDAFIGVDASYLSAALDQIDTDWGSLSAYFEGAGIDETHRQPLRTLLSEPVQV